MAQVIPCYALEKAQNLRPKAGGEATTATTVADALKASNAQAAGTPEQLLTQILDGDIDDVILAIDGIASPKEKQKICGRIIEIGLSNPRVRTDLVNAANNLIAFIDRSKEFGLLSESSPTGYEMVSRAGLYKKPALATTDDASVRPTRISEQEKANLAARQALVNLLQELQTANKAHPENMRITAVQDNGQNWLSVLTKNVKILGLNLGGEVTIPNLNTWSGARKLVAKQRLDEPAKANQIAGNYIHQLIAATDAAIRLSSIPTSAAASGATADELLSMIYGNRINEAIEIIKKMDPAQQRIMCNVIRYRGMEEPIIQISLERLAAFVDAAKTRGLLSQRALDGRRTIEFARRLARQRGTQILGAHADATGAQDVTKNTQLEVGGHIYQSGGNEYYQFKITGIEGEAITCRNLYSDDTRTFQRTDFNIRIGGGWRYLAPGTISIEEAIAADAAKMAATRITGVKLSTTTDEPFSIEELTELRQFIINNNAFPGVLIEQRARIDNQRRLALSIISANPAIAGLANSLLETIKNTPVAMLNDDKTNASINYVDSVRQIAATVQPDLISAAIYSYIIAAEVTNADKLSSEIRTEIAIKTTKNSNSSKSSEKQDAEITALNVVLNQKIVAYRELASKKSALVLDADPIRQESIVKFLVDEMGFKAGNVHTRPQQETYDLVVNNMYSAPEGINLGSDTYLIQIYAMSTQIDIENNKRILEKWLILTQA